MAGKKSNLSQKPAPGAKPAPLGSVKQQPHTVTDVLSNKVLIILLALVSIVLYANTLKNGFVLDDTSVITKNAITAKGFAGIAEALSAPYRHGFQVSINDLYRPLTMAMFAAEYQFFGINPMPYHLFNILLFAAAVILLFLFLDNLFEQKKTTVAFLASLLFALHPLHTEVVANIKSGDELLCFCFAFLSLSVFLNYFRSGKTTQLVLGMGLYFLALMSKETVITFLAIIPLIFCFYYPRDRRRGIYITVSAIAVATIFLAIRFSVLSAYHANSITAVDIVDNALAKQDLSFSSRIATAIFILGDYIKLLLIPAPLICDYSYSTIPFVNFGNPLVLLSLAAYMFLAIFGIRRFLKNSSDPYALWILFYLITLALFSNIPFLIGATMGERFLFFPSVSFCVVIALLINGWIGGTGQISVASFRNPRVSGIIIPLAIIYAIIVIGRNTDWESNYTLYSADVKKAPESAKLNYWLGLELELNIADTEKDPAKLKEILDEAITYLRKSLQVKPEFVDAQITIGHAYAHNYQYDSAEYHDKIAMQLSPERTDPVNNLAGVYFHLKQYPEAIAYYKKTIDIDPGFVNPYANIAACYGTLNKFDSSIYYAMRAINVDPSFPTSYEILAATYKITGQADSSKKYGDIAHKNNPNFTL